MSVIEKPEEVVEAKPVTNRAQMYTFGELIRAMGDITLPGFVWKVIFCQEPVLSVIYLFVGLFALDLLASYSLVKLVGLVGLTILCHGIAYATIRPYVRFAPYENLLTCRIDLTLCPEKVDRVVGCVTNWINRWVATVQFLLFGDHLLASFLVGIALLELHAILRWVEISLIKFAYCMAFVLPRIWRIFRLWLELQPPHSHAHWLISTASMGKDLVLEAIEKAAQELELIRERILEREQLEGPGDISVGWIDKIMEYKDSFEKWISSPKTVVKEKADSL
ncbi:uncharacterized protein LOC108051152 [Drosophila rhopaloa]|uniref:Uncharacterized protein LOC108051152 n=1 Tax=Drosophila rhopaloa TaxID=1041015 RepID=A0A6P4FMD6_DRORH|nr:uncharacterized protein LOC108051152 [Drosophila rhopaloa]